ncbi:MAG TPA: hypothetical protein VN414_12625, partial [Methanosarcina sp.]|nr:hypothetical protein [Methanosarcina sp.]
AAAKVMMPGELPSSKTIVLKFCNNLQKFNLHLSLKFTISLKFTCIPQNNGIKTQITKSSDKSEY